MPDRFKNKYRIESTRLQHWDYGWNASYFITICTRDRICFFGDVQNWEMKLNDVGLIAQDCWLQIPEYFPFVKLGEYVVMPNHVHGIIIIVKSDDGHIDNHIVGQTDGQTDGRTDGHLVETRLIASLPNANAIKKPGGITGNNNPMLRENLSKIIRWYKGRTTFESRKFQTEFGWQSRFHDHIIRDENSFQKISNYIQNNPTKWKGEFENKFLRFHT